RRLPLRPSWLVGRAGTIALVGRGPKVDFGGDDAAPAAEPAGEEDRLAEAQPPAVGLGNLLGHLDLLEGRFYLRPSVPRVGGREGHPQQEDRVAVSIYVGLRLVSENPAQVD